MKGLSRMWLKSQVRFLEEGERVIALSYSAKSQVRFLEEGERVIALPYSANPKMGTRSIAKQLNLSRNAVRNALRSEDPPEYKRKAYITHLRQIKIKTLSVNHLIFRVCTTTI